MTPIIRMLASLVALTLPISAHAEPATQSAPVSNNASTSNLPVSVQNLPQARQQMEELQFNMLELQGILAQKEQNMTLVKTKTSWIRKRLSDLHTWSLNHPTTDATEKLFNKFCWLIGDMEEEVKRDDMLDSIELQALLINYTQLENMLSQIERSVTSPAP